ncbi:hypothetical protein ACFSLT_16330 [Novosphingobium resinovorum]
MKPGTRLKSAACDTEVMVIRAAEGQIECGGAPMGEAKPAEAAPSPPTSRHIDGQALCRCRTSTNCSA